MDFLTEKRGEIEGRLSELKPLVDEYHRLEAAAAALSGVNGTTPTPEPTAPLARKATTTGTAKRGRPKGSGTRAAEALAMVKQNPGIEIPVIAERMGIKQNYLYRVLPGLAKDGLVRKQGRGWHPTNA